MSFMEEVGTHVSTRQIAPTTDASIGSVVL